MRSMVNIFTALSVSTALSWAVERICLELAVRMRSLFLRLASGVPGSKGKSERNTHMGTWYYVDEKGNRFASADDMYDYHRAVTVSQLEINRFL